MGKGIFLMSVLALASTSFGATILNEQWDTYATGTSDPNYVANWAQIPSNGRFAVSTTSPFSSPNSISVTKNPGYGITRNLAPELAALGGTEFNGTAANPLTVRFIVNLGSVDNAGDDVFMEVSDGATHVDATSGTLKSVIAFGLTYGFIGGTGSDWVRLYDGTNWLQTTVSTTTGAHVFTLMMTDTDMTLTGMKGSTSLGSFTTARNYTGTFDTVSLRSVAANGGSGGAQVNYIDDTYIANGVITPEPVALVSLGLGMLLVLRRRRA